MMDRTHVLITGATGGIGAAVSRQLATLGCHLTLIARDAGRLSALADEVRAKGGMVTEMAISLDGGTDFDTLVRRASQCNGPVDILINNAAVNWFGHFGSMPDQDIAALVETNILVPIRMTQAVLASIQRNRRGIVVNIGSVFGSIGFAGFPVYSACKFAVRGFSEALRRELRGSGIKVVYVAPRYTRTAFNEGAVERMAQATGMAMDAPESVARRIVDAIISQRSETIIGWPERLFAKLNALMPRLVDRGLIGKSRQILTHAPGNAAEQLPQEEKQ
nr:SDR family oxidoreductase [uncultured Dongia sp.]